MVYGDVLMDFGLCFSLIKNEICELSFQNKTVFFFSSSFFA